MPPLHMISLIEGIDRDVLFALADGDMKATVWQNEFAAPHMA
jgi:hypothetical protein